MIQTTYMLSAPNIFRFHRLKKKKNRIVQTFPAHANSKFSATNSHYQLEWLYFVFTCDSSGFSLICSESDEAADAIDMFKARNAMHAMHALTFIFNMLGCNQYIPNISSDSLAQPLHFLYL